MCAFSVHYFKMLFRRD